jgi:hypothetical protein
MKPLFLPLFSAFPTKGLAMISFSLKMCPTEPAKAMRVVLGMTSILKLAGLFFGG